MIISTWVCQFRRYLRQRITDTRQTDTVITHPNVTFYDFYAAWSTPIESDKNSYLSMSTLHFEPTVS
jgi:hypothetical protein